jgi:hypothetical protein
LSILRLQSHGLGLEGAREAVAKQVHDVEFKPADATLSEPKEGEHDLENKPHFGGNRWAGGVRPSYL